MRLVTHISLGVLVVLVTAIEGSGGSTARLVYPVAAVVPLALATLTAMTGARTPEIWFRVCPFVLTGVAALLVGTFRGWMGDLPVVAGVEVFRAGAVLATCRA